MTANIPTPHIDATNPNQIANTVLMPGDPLRAKFIADTYLEDVEQFNATRGMLGFTGTYKGKRVSVMGSGMGIPSASIYYHELFAFYDVECIIRIGTAGSLQADIELRDLVVATGAATDSSINEGRFGRTHYQPGPDFDLVFAAKAEAENQGINAHFGSVKSSDHFYDDEDGQYTQKLADNGILCVEMEAAGLYTYAARNKKSALAMFTISDSLVTNEAESAEDRQTAYTQMMELALEIAPE